MSCMITFRLAEYDDNEIGSHIFLGHYGLSIGTQKNRHSSSFTNKLRRCETHVEHYGVRERELQWRSKRDIPNVFHVALRDTIIYYKYLPKTEVCRSSNNPVQITCTVSIPLPPIPRIPAQIKNNKSDFCYHSHSYRPRTHCARAKERAENGGFRN